MLILPLPLTNLNAYIIYVIMVCRLNSLIQQLKLIHQRKQIKQPGCKLQGRQ